MFICFLRACDCMLTIIVSAASGGTGIRGLTRGLVTHSQGAARSLYFCGQRQRWKTPKNRLVVHHFCICRDGGLLEGLLGVNRSMEREFLSLLSSCDSLTRVCYCILLGISYCVMYPVFVFMCALV